MDVVRRHRVVYAGIGTGLSAGPGAMSDLMDLCPTAAEHLQGRLASWHQDDEALWPMDKPTCGACTQSASHLHSDLPAADHAVGYVIPV